MKISIMTRKICQGFWRIFIGLMAVAISACTVQPVTVTPSPTVPPTITATLTPTPPPTLTPIPKPIPIAGGWDLGRAFTKLENGEGVTLGFLGGSITAGTGASNLNVTSYRGLVTQWFVDRYPNVKIQSLNAGAGGTGSQYGAFRSFHDIGVADLVFIEFAVNDGAASPSNKSDYLKYTEGIVRHLYLVNPDVEIVFIDLARDFTAKQYAAGIIPTIVTIHQELSNHYTIPGQNAILYINPGKDLVDFINSGQANWTGDVNPMTIDGVHPNDTGHKFIADKVIAALEQARTLSSPLPSFSQLPASLSTAPIENGQLVDTKDAVWQPSGWEYKSPGSTPTWFTSQLNALVVGASLDYAFTGQYIGVNVIQVVQGGAFDAWVDDGPAKNYSMTGPFTMRNLIMVSEVLAPGPHTLHIRVTALPVTILAFATNP